ncbi:hypothetical protein FACS189454_01590 [Planctomycetales bacterium]|nr:hypothetical protein FACS189454_01590 [Planctomycetales bacterium]
MFVYFAVIGIGLTAFFFFRKNPKLPKLVIFYFGNIFSSAIRDKIYVFAWSLISCFKDLADNVNHKKLAALTAVMWACYFGSYFLFCRGLQSLGHAVSFSELFVHTYSVLGVMSSALELSQKNTASVSVYLFVFTLLPAVVMIFASAAIALIPRQWIPRLLIKIGRNTTANGFIKIIPFANTEAKMTFMERYFAANDRGYCEAYIDANRDIEIVKDFSGGSHATTLLIERNGKYCFRKYAFGDACQKLRLQAEWLEEQQSTLPLPKILSSREEKNLFSYDMPYEADGINFFDAVHCNDTQTCWSVLHRVLVDLDRNLHQPNLQQISLKPLEKYIDEKCVKNLEIIKQTPVIAELLRYDYLIVNGLPYRNLHSFDKLFSPKHLKKVFMNDLCSDIHGDLTIENIIFAPTHPNGYYLIDPNHLNIHNSPMLDYGKVLQSLHFGYEFLIHSENCMIEENRISFPVMRSLAYEKLYREYRNFLYKKFSTEQIRSIYHHEIVHYLRLIPYKIEKFPHQAAMFFATLLQLLDEVEHATVAVPNVERRAA